MTSTNTRMTRHETAPDPVRLVRPALLGISLAYFMVLLDTTVLAVAEPDLMSSLHTDVIGVGWTTTSYTAALAATLVLGGSLADRLGPHRVFVVGCAGFGILSLASALSPVLLTLLLCRTALGLLAAAIIPSSLGLLVSMYPDPRVRARAIGVWAAVSGSALALGPVVGGSLVELSGWRAVFLVNVPLSVVVLLLCRRLDRVERHERPISLLPHLGLVVALAALTFAIVQAGQRSWGTCLAATVAASALGASTARLDRRSPAPLVPGQLRGQRQVWRAFGWGAVVNYALTTILFAVPLTLRGGPVATGATLLPMTALAALNPMATGRITARFGPLLPIRMGFAAFVTGLTVTAIALAGDQQRVVLGIGLFACGLGVSWTLPPLVGYAVSRAPTGATGAVGGILNATRQVGATVGAATASATLTARSDGPWVAAPLLGAAVLCVVGLISSLTSSGDPD